MKVNKQLLYSALCVLGFVIIALIYCAPILNGKGIIQPDIVQYKGMAQEATKFQQENKENTYWSNAMFGGMPTYQTGAQHNFYWIKLVDKTLRFLPRPADYLFLLFGGFFILGLVLCKNWKYALLGSIFFSFCSYFFIITAAGHNAKVHAIAYFAPVVAGILLLYRGKYILGFLLSTLFLGLQLAANHPQMTYYLLLAMLIFVGIEFYDSIKQKKISQFAKASGLLFFASLLALGMNSAKLLTTYEYGQESIRGKSEISLADNNNTGLEKEYITQWSYGKTESLNLLIPNFMGGESHSNDKALKNYKKQINRLGAQTDPQFIANIAQHQLYWGNQPFTSGPAYQGAIVVFFFFLGLFFVKDKMAKLKWWLLGATILSLLLAWGKNFQFFTDFFIDYVPLYDKFRAVSSILVIAELTMPILAILAVYSLTNHGVLPKNKQKQLWSIGGVFLVFILILYFFGGTLFSFESDADIAIKSNILDYFTQNSPEQVGLIDGLLNDLQSAIQQDRIALFKADALRSFVFVALAFAALLAYQHQIIKQKIVLILLLGTLALIDGWSVAKRYFNEDNFGDKSFVENPYPTQINNKMIRAAKKSPQLAGLLNKVNYNQTLENLKKEDSSVYRVYNAIFNTFNEANTSYFHHSIGGYHGAKLGRYQDLINLYFTDDDLSQELGTSNKTENILNMLNAKYEIGGDLQQPEIVKNDLAFGNAWLADSIVWVNDANAEILALKEVQKNQAILRSDLYPTLKQNRYQKDSVSSIELVSYKPNHLTYKVNLNQPKFAVFSEIFYQKGWLAYASKKPNLKEESLDIVKTNYLLRGLDLQTKGTYYIDFYFEPSTVKLGENISLAANILFILLVLGGGFLLTKQKP